MRNLDIPDKNQLFGDFLTSIEDEWMEKDVVNSYVRECGGISNTTLINLIQFRKERFHYSLIRLGVVEREQ